MASVELSRRVEEGGRLSAAVRDERPAAAPGEFHEALLEAHSSEDCRGKWQAAILKAEEARPTLRIVSSE